MESSLKFQMIATSGGGRAGMLATQHGEVPTPAFMPVATQGSVKSLTPEEVRAVGAHMILGNTYHLYLRPGVDLVKGMGGLQSFTGWTGPILTDSGGYQAFSLGPLKRIGDDGISFRSHIDGSEHFFTPEDAILYQHSLGADIIMCLDQCIANGEARESVRLAMERTHDWAARCIATHNQAGGTGTRALFGIVQGGVFPELRSQSAGYITSLGFDGYAVGGLAVGEDKAAMYDVTGQVGSLLPQESPRYLMGVGSPEDLVECVALGMDLFDCALPTRVARNGGLFTATGRVDITSRRFKDASGPLQQDCDCYTCGLFSAAYLHHLFRSKELLGLRLASIHNLRFVLRLMEEMRAAIIGNEFLSFRKSFLDRYRPTDQAARLSQKEASMVARGIKGPVNHPPRREQC